MFWGATAGPHINWNGFELRLDGGLSGTQVDSPKPLGHSTEVMPDLSDVRVWCVKHAGAVPAPVAQADELKKQMPPEQTQWLADVDAMQAAFRHVRHGC
jgi:hypothetical protein